MEYGLIGEHLKHSFSKQIHEDIAGYKYEIKEIARDDLASFMMSKDFKAINVTIPYKEMVIPYLDELDESAKLVGAVNTVVNRGGRLIGYNTDMPGFIALLKHMELDVNGKSILLLGNGGASKAVVAGLNKLGVNKIVKASIEGEKDCISYDEIYDQKDIDIVVNTTPVGMFPHNDGKLVDLEKLSKPSAFVDVIYNPIRTRTVIEAQDLRMKAEGGLYMLVAQALYAIEIFLDKKLDEKIIDEVYKKILRENSNIVLIGMPTCGKSTIGKMVADHFGFEFVDTDQEIVDDIEMPIKDYFAKHGEEAFRKLETEVVKNHYLETKLVVSTGGGVIKYKINMDLLRQNGIIVFVKRDLNLLRTSSSRPLSSNRSNLEKLYQERLPIYEKYADIIIENNEDVFKDAARKLVDLL